MSGISEMTYFTFKRAFREKAIHNEKTIGCFMWQELRKLSRTVLKRNYAATSNRSVDSDTPPDTVNGCTE